MNVSPLNAQAWFQLRDYLPEDASERLTCVPGVQVWRAKPVVRCAWSASAAVRNLLPPPVLNQARYVTDAYLPPPVPESWIPADPVPAPLWRDFLVDYQRRSIGRLLRVGGGVVEAPTGAGKTVMGDVAALTLVRKQLWAESKGCNIILTVCKAAARGQQVEEKERFYGVTPFAIKPATLVRKRDKWKSVQEYLSDPSVTQPWLVVSWAGLVALLPMLSKLPIGCVIYDEAHYAKSSDRVKWEVYVDDEGDTQFEKHDRLNRSAAAARLAAVVPHRILTTATPTKNLLQDWWGLLNLVERPAYGHKLAFEAYGSTNSKFLLHYCNGEPGPFGGIVTHPPHHSNVDELRERVTPVRVRIPYKVLSEQLPPKRRRVQTVPLDAQDKSQTMSRTDRQAYRKALRELAQAERKQAVEGLEIRKERVTVWRLQDACNRKKTATVDLICDTIDNACGSLDDPSLPRGKVLVFFGLVRALEVVAQRTKKKRPHARVWVAHGGGCSEVDEEGNLVPTDIDTMRNAYMNQATPAVIVGTYQYLGESFNMQDTDSIIVGMLPYTPGEVAQIEGRGARLGQARPLDVVYLVAEGTIDERSKSIVLGKLPAVSAMGEGAHGLDGLDMTLRGIEDLEGVLDAFLESCTSEEEEDEG